MDSPLTKFQNFIHDPALPLIADGISPRMFKFTREIVPLFWNTYHSSHSFLTWPEEMCQIFLAFRFDKKESEAPKCSKLIRKAIECKQCKQNYVIDQRSIYFCQDCFREGEHQGHNFRIVDELSTLCSCGEEKENSGFFTCSRHKGVEDHPEEQDFDSQSLVYLKQLQFLSWLFLETNAATSEVLDESRKKSQFGKEIVRILDKFTAKSYTNQKMVGHILSAPLPFEQELITPNLRDRPLLALFMEIYKLEEFFQLFLSWLLSLIKVRAIRYMVTIELFSCENFYHHLKASKNILLVSYHFTKEKRLIEQLMEEKKLPIKLVERIYFDRSTEKIRGFEAVFYRLRLLLGFKNSQKMLEYILREINVYELTNILTPKEQKEEQSNLPKLNMSYIDVCFRMIKTAINRKDLLTIIIRQTFRELPFQKSTICLSLERLFGMALFAYYGCSLDNLNKLDPYYLLQLLEEQSEEDLLVKLKQLIGRYMKVCGDSNFKRYYDSMQPESKYKYVNSLFYIDHIYLKLLFKMVFVIERSELGLCFSPLEQFIEKRRKRVERFYDLCDEEEFPRLEELLLSQYVQISKAVYTILYLSESKFNEVVLANYLEVAPEQEVFEFYRYLLYISPAFTKKNLKLAASKYINNQKMMRKFVQEEYRSALFEETVESLNGLSFNSFYMKFASKRQSLKAYQYKLNYYKRNQLSRQVISYATMQQIIKLFTFIFDAYEKKLKKNQNQISRQSMNYCLQMLIALQLQTSNRSLEQLIDSILDRNILREDEEGPYQWDRDMWRMKKEKQKKAREQIEMKEAQSAEKRKKMQIQQKKASKFNKIKANQSHMLNLLVKGVQEQQKKVEESHKRCIVCKNEDGSLKYLCHWRVNNLMSKSLHKENYPVELITTCGHLIHDTCLSTARRDRQQNEEFSCFLCSSKCNLIVDASVQPDCNASFELMGKMFSLQQNRISRNQIAHKILRQKYPQINSLSMKLVISIVYTIFGYSLYYPKYFLRKIFPVVSQLLKLIKGPSLRMSPEDWFVIQDHFQKVENNKILNLTVQILINLDKKQAETMDILKNFVEEVQNGDDQNQIERTLRHIDFLQPVFEDIEKDSFERFNDVEVQKQNIPRFTLALPQDLVDLNKMIGICPFCHNPTSKIMLCYLCTFRACESCHSKLIEHTAEHLGQGVFVLVENGYYYYSGTVRMRKVDSLYLNYALEGISAEQFPERNEFLLHSGSVEKVENDLVEGKVWEGLDRESYSSIYSVRNFIGFGNLFGFGE